MRIGSKCTKSTINMQHRAPIVASKRKLLLQHADASCGNMLFQLLPQHVKFVELAYLL